MSSLPPSGAPRRRWPQQSLTDLALGAVGFSMAAASASFASYMIATAPADVTGFGSKDFSVFVRWDKRSPEAAAAAKAVAAAARPIAPVQTASGIDATPTGSIPAEGNVTREPRSTPDVVPATGTLRDFHVRNVVGDRALIEHRSRLTLVQPGSILAGAGEVLAIERRGDNWIVRTAGGVIGGS